MLLVRLSPLTLSVVALLYSAPLAGQNINNSNAINTGVTISTISGMFTPGSGAVAQGGSVSFAAVSALTNSLAAGQLASPLTGATISPSVGAQISALLAGAPGSLEALQGQLNASGAPTAETARLLLSLVGLTKNGRGGRSGDTDRGPVVRSLVAFNALIQSATPAFLTNAPPSLVAIHAVLSSLTEAGNQRP